ncbi:DUF4185 domain-containing protein [Microbacterium sp. NPDC057659]|uniref:DUF4185 domain-containing protein n=1 Tax=Microbacterium sp. NPDC057659 TaxID=3346198 RepID=UPI00367237C0
MSARRAVSAATAAGLLVLALAGCAASSTPIASASVADAPTAIGVSDGDLWPNCWSGDGALYAANGDGAGFGSVTSDIVMNRIDGSPASDLTGVGLATGDELGQVWTTEEGYTRKPTGMLCVGGSLYLAVQDLAPDFNAAPNATIARSDDHGKTWSWDTDAPMFADGTFTTIWFADYGEEAERRPDDEYVYAYGLDGNWRDSFTDIVPDPTELFLARVPVKSVQDAATWQFYAGPSSTSGIEEQPTWTDDIAKKRPVLVDDRRVHDLSVLSQGGVTYLPKHDRYVYTSWTEYSFEFYEAPQPWGPWKTFLSEDFGEYPWQEERIGGYSTTVPSKFVAEDEKTVWVQSNVCPCAPAGVSSYWFGLREMTLSD